MGAFNNNALNLTPDNNGKRESVSLEMIDFNPEWQFKDSKTGVFYKNGIIPQKLFITFLGGNIQPESAKRAIDILEKMFQSGVLTNCEYIRIADYNEVINAPFSTRILYANSLNRLNSTYNCRPSITYICGASLLLKTMLRLFASYVKQLFIFVPTVQDAFVKINTGPNLDRVERDRKIVLSQQEIDQFATLCGHILFNESFTFDEKLNGVSPDNPLHDLYTIISLLNNDLRELQKTEKEQKKQIEDALEDFRMLNSQLSVQKKNVEEKEQIQQILIKNLTQARKEAETANRAKSEFLANLSHEIITPLHAVIGMTDLLCSTSLNSEQKTYTDTIQMSTQQLHQLLNNILEFSKNVSGKLDSEQSIFDIRRLFDDISSLLLDEALKKRLLLTFAIPNSIPTPLLGYPAFLLKVLINLVENAIKFSEKGEIVVSIRHLSETSDDITLCISVKDSGIGIPEGKKELILQQFTQLDSSATRKAGGTGLGLAIAKQLIEFMGGTLNLCSVEHEGSEFWFILAFIKPQENSNLPKAFTAMQERVSPSEKELSGSQQSIENALPINNRILLVEDNSVNQRVAKAMLNKLGCTVDIAANGFEALDALQQNTYALVIMDLQMPLMGGLEATKEIRKQATGRINPNIPIIAMTANATKEDHNNCLKAGMNDFISKPVMMTTLQTLLQKWVR
ncbi:MAG: response regulator [Chlorobiaceae bacterium]|jgi:two-component system, sensor histidine kinase